VKQTKGDLDGALADYNRAIELNPKDAKAYTNRGLVKQARADLDGALADYARAVELDPKDVLAYYNQGVLKKDRGDLSGALADYTRAIELDPKFALFYNNRGNVKYDQGLWIEALADYRKALDLRASGWEGEEYAWLRIWLLSARLGGPGDLEEANKELSGHFQTERPGKDGDWGSQTARFLVGELSEADFLKAAESADEGVSKAQRCEAYFYAGARHLINRRTAEAKEYFQKCVATGLKSFAEYQSAQAELKRLEQ
jgi:lipoprotein NlpI